MKTRIIFFALFIACAVMNSVNAQMLIKDDGRVYVGNEPRYNDDYDKVLNMSIQGRHGEYNAGAKLGFGDFGGLAGRGWNVFIGEWKSEDTDKLWLHGKRGVVASAFSGDYLVYRWLIGDDYVPHFTFYDGVRIDRLSISSDDEHKSDIQPIPYALPRLMNLNGIKYHYQSLNNQAPVGDIGDTGNPGELSQKELDDMAQYDATMQARDNGSMRYGLKAGEVNDNFPELIDVDEQGSIYINYIELIPVMVSAFGELCDILEQNGLEFGIFDDYLRSSHQDSTDTVLQTNSRRTRGSLNMADSAVLHQNTPNPFTVNTTVEYYVPTSATSASLFVFNLIGELQQSYPISTLGHGSVQINGQELTSGMYLYSLVVDGRVVDTKRMILTR